MSTNRRTLGVVVLAAALGAGCATIDPTAERAEAAALAAERTGADTGFQRDWREPSPAWAGTLPLDAEAAVAVALQHDLDLRRRLAAVDAARARLAAEDRPPNPVLAVAIGVPTDGFGGSPLAASAMQQLAWLWTRDARLDAAVCGLRAAVLDAAGAAVALAAEVRTAHAALVVAERSEVRAADRAALRNDAWMLASARRDAGEATADDVDAARSRAAEAAIALAAVRQERDAARLALLALLGRPGAALAIETDGALDGADPALDAMAPERLAAIILERRLDVAAARARAEQAGHRIRLADARRAPEISAGVGYEQNFSGREALFPRIAVTLPILDDGTPAVALAAAEAESAGLEAERVARAALAEARGAWIALHGARERLERHEEGILAPARASLERTLRARQTGEADRVAAILAELALLEAGDARDALAFAVAAERIALERALGGRMAVAGGAS